MKSGAAFGVSGGGAGASAAGFSGAAAFISSTGAGFLAARGLAEVGRPDLRGAAGASGVADGVLVGRLAMGAEPPMGARDAHAFLPAR